MYTKYSAAYTEGLRTGEMMARSYLSFVDLGIVESAIDLLKEELSNVKIALDAQIVLRNLEKIAYYIGRGEAIEKCL